MRHKAMEFLYHSSNTDVRIMNRDDIPIICKAGNDESKHNITYLENQLSNQDKQESDGCSYLRKMYQTQMQLRMIFRRPLYIYTSAS